LHLSVPSSAVEFGQDATGDPNAVKVGGASGFLYSERIVLTAAHVVAGYPDMGETERQKNISRWEREGVIYNPGIVSVVGQKYYKVKKLLSQIHMFLMRIIHATYSLLTTLQSLS
jgi:V8-like Glu-specific endopeptidase